MFYFYVANVFHKYLNRYEINSQRHCSFKHKFQLYILLKLHLSCFHTIPDYKFILMEMYIVLCLSFMPNIFCYSNDGHVFVFHGKSWKVIFQPVKSCYEITKNKPILHFASHYYSVDKNEINPTEEYFLSHFRNGLAPCDYFDTKH